MVSALLLPLIRAGHPAPVVYGRGQYFILLSIFSSLPSKGWAQQNLFNVPSAEITEKNKFFFQQQFNIDSNAGDSNTTVDYGLGNNWEVGINLFNLDLYPTNCSIHNPHFLVNF
jgi:hypothetical protein